ncbi:MAG: glycosyl hydrolase [Terracidiphilus sp.]
MASRKVYIGMISWRKLALLLTFLMAGPFAAVHGQTRVQQDALRAGFLEPPAAAKLRCYWWWLNGNVTEESITRDLEGMKSHGYAGAILVDADGSGQGGNREMPAGPAIGSPQWMKLYVHALAVAQKLGLQISLNITSRWDVGIIGGPTVTPEDAIKLLTYSRTIVEGGAVKTVQLPAPRIENGFYRQIAVLAYPLRHGAPLAGEQGSERAAIEDLRFKTASMETGFSMARSSRVLRNAPSVSGEQDAAVSQVVDVSSHVGADGVLHWTFPAGTWEVLRIGYTDTWKHLTDAAGTPLGLPLDAMNAHAFDDYWRQHVMPLLVAAKPYIGTSLRYLVTDSWEAGGANWTEGFREQFERRRGYDPLPYLPIVTGRILTSREVSNRFLFDLRRTVADLIAENYYDSFAGHAAKMGLGTHPEAGGPHGAPIDALRNFRSASFPQTEFWVVSGTHRVTDQQRFFVKEAASAAHIYGKPFVAAEGPTSMDPDAWSESPGRDVQPTIDHAFTEGLNRLFWHEFTSSPAKYGKPGQEYFAGTHLNPNVTWWNQAGPFLLALNREQFLMQQGRSVDDLLYFYGEQVPGLVRVKNDDPAQVLPGYDYDVTDEDALLHRMQFSGADLHTPEGLHYRALALPESRHLSYPALAWVKGFVQQGGVVIGLKPAGPLGIVPARQQAEYTQLADKMWSGCAHGAAESNFGKGRIYCTQDARAALQAIGVAPDFSYRLDGENASVPEGSVFDYVHRETADADIYFVRNSLDRSVKATLSFRVRNRAPELWTADDGSTAPALVYRQTGGRTEIPLTFPAMGSVFLVFEKPSAVHLTQIRRGSDEVYPSIRQGDGTFAAGGTGFVALNPGAYRLTESNGLSTRVVVAPDDPPGLAFGSWTLSFPPGWGAPSSVPLAQFRSWTQWIDPGIRYFSGTATYHAVLHVPAGLILPGRQIWLNLGKVREIASVSVNGNCAGTLWRAPFLVRIDRQLHTGNNEVAIQVTNLWPNRIIGDLQPSATVHYTHTNTRAYTTDSPLLPSGLLTPVRVKVGETQRVAEE